MAMNALRVKRRVLPFGTRKEDKPPDQDERALQHQQSRSDKTHAGKQGGIRPLASNGEKRPRSHQRREKVSPVNRGNAFKPDNHDHTCDSLVEEFIGCKCADGKQIGKRSYTHAS